MHRRMLLSTAAVLALAPWGASVLAQPRPDDDRRREGPPGERGREGPRGERDRPDERDGRPGFDRRGPERPPEAWRRGGRLPPEYRNRSYVVEDWRGHRLPRPPRGQYWVAVGGDYLLVAIATGVIVQVLPAR